MGGLRLSVRASSYNSFLNDVIVVALICTLVLNLITQTSFFCHSLRKTTEVLKFAYAFKLGSALLNLSLIL